MQYKNKKNLYKIVFITILLGFIISLAGCNWLSLGLLNIFDPQAQIRVNYTEINLEEGTINLEVYSINEVEFIGSGFEYEYYVGTTKIPELSKMVGATFYVAPSTSPGSPGAITTINLDLYYQEVEDYLNLNPLITEITCTINLIGTDGAGHNITKSVTFDLPALEPGIDFTPPTAVINTTPYPPSGTAPFTVVFDASKSYDNEPGDALIRIESYNWDFGDGTSATGVMPAAHTYTSCGSYIVKLTVTDFWGNEGYATVIITVGETGGPNVDISVTPGTTGTAPFTVYFDASGTTFETECGCGTATYSWNFGDGGSGTGVTTSHTYTSNGIYTVILTVTDAAGNVGYGSVIITVGVAGEVNAVIKTTPDPPSGTAPFTVYFDAYESESEAGIASYSWNYGDGSTAGTGVTTSHEYTKIGTYIATLTITDYNGKKGYDSVEVTVEKAPSAVINTTPTAVNGIVSGNFPFTVYFDAYESTSESGIVSYAWSFGDGSTATGITTNHTYSTSDTYIVYLTITDSNGYEAYDSVIVSEPTVEATVTAVPDIISPPPGNSTITAFFAYSTGSPVPNGTTVNFTITGAVGATLSASSDTTTNGYAATILTMTEVGVVVVHAETIYASGSVTVTCAE